MSVAPPVAGAPDRRAQLKTGVVAGRGILAALTVVVGAACSASTSSDTGGSTPPTEAGSALSDPAVDGTPATSGGEAAAPITAAPSTAAPVRPEGFTQVMLRVVESTDEVCEICVWLADAGDERSRGLMGVTDLGEPVGMAFAYSAATAGRFFMFQTPMPLSIAWFSATGDFVGSADMEPCVDEPRNDCLRYSPDAEFALAVEVPQGLLGEHGLGPGSTAEVLFGTEGITCPD